MSRPSRSRRGLLGTTLVLVMASGAFVSVGAQNGPPPFDATASAQGTHLFVTVPGGPVTDTPVDAGGPTAQVSLDSLGNSQGYAAFPDPGPLVISAPGLIAGSLSSEGIDIPPLPDYPFFIASDPAQNPDASAGAGPYSLHASSSTTKSDSQASAGLESAAGNTALVTSDATVESDSGGVVVEATSEAQGITVGPLSIGRVRSTARLVLSEDGFVTPHSDIDITSVRIGGVGVNLGPEGIDLGGPTVVPLPIAPALDAVLEASGVKVEIAPSQTLSDGVTAPALRISTRFDASHLGSDEGTLTVVLGDVAVHLGQPTVSAPLPQETTSPPTRTAGGTEGTPQTTPATTGRPATPAATGIAAGPQVPEAPQPTPSRPLANMESEPTSQLVFDATSLYLTLAVLAAFAFGTGQAIRLFGVRSP